MRQYNVGDIEDFKGPYIVDGDGQHAVTFTDVQDYFLEPVYRLITRDLVAKRREQRRPSSLHTHMDVDTGPDEFEQGLMEDYAELRDEGEAYVEVKDNSGWKTFNLNPRNDSSPYSPSTPFSILIADHDKSDARFGVRIARSYDDDILELNKALGTKMLVDDMPEEEYEARWLQEPDYMMAALRPDGVNDKITERYPVLDPIVGRDPRVVEFNEKPEFRYADFEMAFVYNWSHDPFAGGVTTDVASQFARREATDQVLGTDKRLDRKPFEYFLDSNKDHDRGFITFGDPEYIILTKNTDDLERDMEDAAIQIKEGMKEVYAMSSGTAAPADEDLMDARINQIKSERDDILNGFSSDIMHLWEDALPSTRDVDVFTGENHLGPEWE